MDFGVAAQNFAVDEHVPHSMCGKDIEVLLNDALLLPQMLPEYPLSTHSGAFKLACVALDAVKGDRLAYRVTFFCSAPNR